MRPLLVIALAVLIATLSASATSAVAGGWIRPVDGAVVRPFAVVADRFAAGQHRGIDLAAPPGAPVRAACGGRVSFAGRVPGGGRTVSVRCGSLLATYQHLGRVAVARGQAVMPGGAIGRAGDARPSPHVHLGARVAATGEYRDPATLFAGAPREPLPPVPVPASRRAPPVHPPPGARPLGPAPAPVRAPAPAPVMLARPRHADPARAPAPRPAVDRLPWPVWLGLALVALGLPLGGGLVVARRSRTARRRAPGAARAGRSAAHG